LDKAAARAQTQSDIRYLVVTGILRPADDEWVKQVSQSSLFDADDAETISTPSPELARARAYSDGYNSGKHGGEAINNPFPAGSAEFVEWEKGRVDGQDDRALRGSGRAAKVADTTPRRGRGRPAGSKNKPANAAEAHA
jgi:hypothetical protein